MNVELHAVPSLTEGPAEGPGKSTPGKSTVSVLIADDHALMRRSLRALLEREPDLAVVAEAEDLAGAVERVRELKPDVLVLDLRLHNGSSIQAVRDLREGAPHTRVVIVTAEDNPLYAEHALAAGALGFVRKEHADVELPEAVRAAMRDERYVSPHAEAKLASYRAIHVDDTLTSRELEVLRLIALGHTSVEVARILEISPRTVESHRARVHSKLGLSTRAELVRYALRRGLLGV